MRSRGNCVSVTGTLDELARLQDVIEAAGYTVMYTRRITPSSRARMVVIDMDNKRFMTVSRVSPGAITVERFHETCGKRAEFLDDIANSLVDNNFGKDVDEVTRLKVKRCMINYYYTRVSREREKDNDND